MEDQSNGRSVNQQNIDQYNNNQKFQNVQPRHRQQLVVPSSKNKLKACMKCHLLKTEDQWLNDQKCENCDIRGNIRGHITAKFQSIVTIIQPSKSWLKKRIGLPKKIVPGVYAVQVFQQY